MSELLVAVKLLKESLETVLIREREGGGSKNNDDRKLEEKIGALHFALRAKRVLQQARGDHISYAHFTNEVTEGRLEEQRSERVRERLLFELHFEIAKRMHPELGPLVDCLNLWSH